MKTELVLKFPQNLFEILYSMVEKLEKRWNQLDNDSFTLSKGLHKIIILISIYIVDIYETKHNGKMTLESSLRGAVVKNYSNLNLDDINSMKDKEILEWYSAIYVVEFYDGMERAKMKKEVGIDTSPKG